MTAYNEPGAHSHDDPDTAVFSGIPVDLSDVDWSGEPDEVCSEVEGRAMDAFLAAREPVSWGDLAEFQSYAEERIAAMRDAASATEYRKEGVTVEDDRRTLDALAELFCLPEWQVYGSGADFIDAAADILGRVRDLTVPAPPEALIHYGLGHYIESEDA